MCVWSRLWIQQFLYVNSTVNLLAFSLESVEIARVNDRQRLAVRLRSILEIVVSGESTRFSTAAEFFQVGIARVKAVAAALLQT
jgi:hypothetical protein